MDFIQYSLKLAQRARGNTSPNPPVGAVVVRDEYVLAEGWTQPTGGSHAEIVALDLAGSKARGATLFISLEPCNYQGRTPPCTEAIIKSGIVEVYIALIDKNPLVNGKGIKELREAGLKVHVMKITSMAEELVEAHNKFQLTGLPFITVKFAMSLDGKIATRSKDSKWITGEKARKLGHELRQISDSIMVGVNTILTDDPQLTSRDEHGLPFKTQPVRVIMDSKGRIPPDSQIFQSPSKILIFTTDLAENSTFDHKDTDVIVMPAKEGRIDIFKSIVQLGKLGITSLLVEGGSDLIGSFFDLNLVDKVVAFIAPVIIGGSNAPSSVGGLGVNNLSEALHVKNKRIEFIGDDLVVTGYCRE